MIAHRHLGVVGMVAFVAAVAGLWAFGSAVDLWSQATAPTPAEVWAAAKDTLGTSAFWSSVGVTLREVVASLVGAVVIGFTLGSLFWKVPFLGRVFEPYLVSFYAIPFVVFYPIMVVLIGFGSWPIIILATTAGTIPMALNTWIGLRSVPRVYWQLAASLQCSRRDTLLRIAIPAAAPLIMAGVRLATIYAVLGCVSTEFLLAKSGLGYQIRLSYELFEQPTMVLYVLVVFVFAATVALSAAALESRIVERRRVA